MNMVQFVPSLKERDTSDTDDDIRSAVKVHYDEKGDFYKMARIRHEERLSGKDDPLIRSHVLEGLHTDDEIGARESYFRMMIANLLNLTNGNPDAVKEEIYRRIDNLNLSNIPEDVLEKEEDPHEVLKKLVDNELDRRKVGMNYFLNKRLFVHRDGGYQPLAPAKREKLIEYASSLFDKTHEDVGEYPDFKAFLCEMSTFIDKGEMTPEDYKQIIVNLPYTLNLISAIGRLDPIWPTGEKGKGGRGDAYTMRWLYEKNPLYRIPSISFADGWMHYQEGAEAARYRTEKLYKYVVDYLETIPNDKPVDIVSYASGLGAEGLYMLERLRSEGRQKDVDRIHITGYDYNDKATLLATKMFTDSGFGRNASFIAANLKDILKGKGRSSTGEKIEIPEHDIGWAAGINDYLPDQYVIGLTSEAYARAKAMVIMGQYLKNCPDQHYFHLYWQLILRSPEELQGLSQKAAHMVNSEFDSSKMEYDQFGTSLGLVKLIK